MQSMKPQNEEHTSLLFDDQDQFDENMDYLDPNKLKEESKQVNFSSSNQSSNQNQDSSQQQNNVFDQTVSDGAPPPLRQFDINQSHQEAKLFCNNLIQTSKYSVITFLPKNLIEQFSKLANIYFLIMMILQCLPQISITNGQPTILVPLLFVIIVSAVKDIFEDLKRHKSDSVENNRAVLRLDRKEKEFVQERWKHLRVGQIVQITQDHFFPADLILIRSSNPSGLAYVETKNLDGETNLKHKQAIKDLQQAVQGPQEASQLRGKVICETPNDLLYRFEGTLSAGSEMYSLDHNSLLVRGSSLKNTEWVYGLVVYTGHETKIMKNSSQSRSKQSKIEVQTNKQIIFVFLFQMMICSFGAGANVLWSNSYGRKANKYLDFDSEQIIEPFLDVMTKFGTWLLLFANFVPISLIVTLELVKFFQAIFIQWDYQIYDEEKDLPTKVQSSNLNEQLGQVDYVFSDKTGTLTCNEMEYKKMCIGKFSYGIDKPNVKDQVERDVTNFNFQDENFDQHLAQEQHTNHENIKNFLIHLAICHTVVTETKEGKQFYNASSPDELALVNCSKYYNYAFQGRDDENNIELLINGQTEVYQLLNVIEFTSSRKRMTVVIKTPDDKIKILCKGADSIILPRLSQSEQNIETKDIINQYLETYAKEGLRTLLICEKEMTLEQYEEWSQQYKNAQKAMSKREEKCDEVASRLEQDFELLGATAIEDKLQDEVDLAISCMKKAGIKVWVLTGDKTETAINIGFSCKLLNEKMEMYIIDGQTKTEVLQQIADSRRMQINSEGLRESATVIAGDSLFKVMQSERIKQQFLKLACSSQVLLACRMSPKQKADIVRMIKQAHPNVVTLAIGDGANDVNMITAAHIGIGISGVEGQQAVSASDYAIGQFKYLRNLLMVHGREAYRRNSYLVCYTFYKNLLFVMPQFWFGFLSGYSGQVFYDKWLFQIFNILFTAGPIMLYAMLDFEHDKNTFLTHPKLYKIGPENQCFSTKIFWSWIFYGVAQSAFVFYIAFYVFNFSPEPWTGRLGDIWMCGTFAYACIVIFSNTRILFDSHSHYFITLFVIVCSALSFWVVFFLMNIWEPSDLFNLYQEIDSMNIYWFTLFIFVFIMFPIDGFIFHVGLEIRNKKQRLEKHKKREERNKFTKGLDASKLAPLHKYRGFAFSGDAGHTPQITDRLVMATRKIMITQQVLAAMRRQ